jgi:hypothetical protein
MLVTAQTASYRTAQEAMPKNAKKQTKTLSWGHTKAQKSAGKKTNTQSVVFKGHALQ